MAKYMVTGSYTVDGLKVSASAAASIGVRAWRQRTAIEIRKKSSRASR